MNTTPDAPVNDCRVHCVHADQTPDWVPLSWRIAPVNPHRAVNADDDGVLQASPSTRAGRQVNPHRAVPSVKGPDAQD